MVTKLASTTACVVALMSCGLLQSAVAQDFPATPIPLSRDRRTASWSP